MGDVKMPKYKPIRIKLNEQEDAEVYYQKVCGKNETVRRHARILYYAGQGTVSLLLERYEKDGITAMYQCRRGKKPGRLDEYEKEIEEELDRHPAKSVPEIIVMLKEKFEITITATPVRNWLKKRGIITDKPKRCRQKQMKRHRNIS